MEVFCGRRTKMVDSFTLIELMVVIAIIGVLSTVMLPQIGGMLDKAKAAKTMAAYNSLKFACLAHYADTGAYAYELYVGYAGSSYHQLSMSQSYNGWNGPYLEVPFGYGINPTKGWPAISSNLGTWNADSGFDLYRNGSADRTGAGNFMHFEQFPSRIALLIDNTIDGSPTSSRYTRGVVEWRSAWGGTIQIYITGGY